MTADAIRSQNDRKLFDVLREDPDVIAAQSDLNDIKVHGYVGMRRRLLATSVRLSSESILRARPLARDDPASTSVFHRLTNIESVHSRTGGA